MPTVPVKTKIRMSGAELLDKNKDARDGDGNPINRHKFYSVRVVKPKTHEKDMKKLLKTKGLKAVNKYINDVVTVAKAQQEAISKTQEQP